MVSRQTETKEFTTRVYKYGLLPKEGVPVPEEAIETLYRANKLWNKLIEIHYEHQKIFDEARRKAHPPFARVAHEYAAFTEKIDKLYKKDKPNARMKAQTRSASDPGIRAINDEIDKLKKERGILFETKLKPARGEADKLFDKAALNKAFDDKIKTARKGENSELNGDMWNAVSNSFSEARAAWFKNPAKSRLRFHSFDGTGYFHFENSIRRKGAQKNGISFDEMFAGHASNRGFLTFLSIDESRRKPTIRISAVVAGRRGTPYIHHEFTMFYHRPIPKDAQIQSVKILRTRVGDKFRWDICFTVKIPIRKAVILRPDDFAIGVDMGFRQMAHELGGDTIVAATIASEDPAFETRKIQLPKRGGEKGQRGVLEGLRYINELKSVLDESATELGKLIKPLLMEKPVEEGQKKHGLWRAAAKVPIYGTLSFETAYKLARYLKYDPDFVVEEARIAILDWWQADFNGVSNGFRFREIHNLRAKMLRQRKDCYRQVAAELVSWNRLIVIETINKSKAFAEVKTKDNELHDTARRNRVWAAPSELIMAIQNAADREGIHCVKIDPKNTSKMCSACGAINRNLRSEERWRCPECKALHDRDENAAIKIARKGKEQFFDRQTSKKGKV
jgi:hypothetical protein